MKKNNNFNFSSPNESPSNIDKIKIIIMAIIGIIYAISPVDIIPDIIPLLGMVDDIVVIIGVVLKIIHTINTRKI